MSKQPLGKLTLIGSGEFLDAMARVHRALLKPYGSDVSAVFIDTPAGFELNCTGLAERAIQYFAQRFEVGLTVASYRSRTATALEVSAALRLISGADYLVAGPGSPTYAIRTWGGSTVWEAIVERFRNGAQLVFASAAAMAVGRRAVPIYEVYRCGDDPHWVEGLDLLGPLGLDLAVMPHWNNTSGTGHDSRFCFMGEERMRTLENLLPRTAVLLGIDEHTACTIDFAGRRCFVEGTGGVTTIRAGRRLVHASGTSFDLAELAAEPCHEGGNLEATPTDSPELGSETPVLARYLSELAAALQSAPEAASHSELIDWIHEATHELSGESAHDDPPAAGDLASLVDLLVRARQELRAAKRFALSDEIRDKLVEMGIQPADPPLPTA